MAGVSLEGIHKSFADVGVIHDVNMQIGDGEFIVFVGPSGCGKSTLLRMVAGLESVTSGRVSIGGTVVNEVAPSKRGVAMVFQSYALYPHMTVYRNMAFGLQQAGLPKEETDRRVRAAAEALDITALLDRTPRALSGGQRQRVAIGRAIVREPEVFLFDEPLSNLDAALRVNTRLEIARLHRRLGATMIYVTHDQVEAMTLADRIVVLREGRIEQIGSPVELYKRPANLFVAGFIGSPKMNFVPASRLRKGAAAGLGIAPPGEAVVGVRPEHLVTCGAGDALFSATLELVENLGEYFLAHLQTADGGEVIVKLPDQPRQKTGQKVHLCAQAANVHCFDAGTGARLGRTAARDA